MEIKPKTNIALYLMNKTTDYFELSLRDPFNPESEDDGYTYILPKSKAFFRVWGQFRVVICLIEKVDESKKTVYLSQTHWVWMKNLIKYQLGLDVKITKRYAGRLTVAELVNPNQRINKALLKQLSEAVGEKIYIKTPKRTI
ncbi:MAG: hypothetical protein M1478_06845 [Deltaproteobacteria bacterium]|jgi:hypothetical protein|nr:hypothetical protein [Deltaproteobacteria bacterium]MCL5880525.1 hypothetical protein [Deltaproteobacteria bacterium]